MIVVGARATAVRQMFALLGVSCAQLVLLLGFSLGAAAFEAVGRRRRHRHQADVVSFSSNLSYFARHGW